MKQEILIGTMSIGYLRTDFMSKFLILFYPWFYFILSLTRHDKEVEMIERWRDSYTDTISSGKMWNYTSYTSLFITSPTIKYGIRIILCLLSEQKQIQIGWDIIFFQLLPLYPLQVIISKTSSIAYEKGQVSYSGLWSHILF